MPSKSGKTRLENGMKEKIGGYAAQCGKSLSELLKEHKEVKVVSMGPDSVNNVLKAVYYAQRMLREEDKDLLVDEVVMEDAPVVRNTGVPVQAKLICTYVKLV